MEQTREPAAAGSALASGEAGGERRHLTLMFCDLVDSSRLGERLDPEDLRSVIARYHDLGAGVIERFEGRVAQYLGDGILAYFAYPQAHEDDAERAVRAALRIVSELEEANPGLEREHGVRLAVRIGIHTGTVVMGDLGRGEHRETLALGHPVNLAARLLRLAEPGSVVISGETLQLVRGLFVTQDLGSRELPGIAEPVAAHRVVQASGVRSRLDVAVATGLTPLVGREPDLALLLDRWERAREGRGRVVLVGGEPGIGKSRLVQAMRDRVASDAHSWLECRGSPYHQNSALHPVVELLRQGLLLTTAQSAEEEIAQIERGLELGGFALDKTVPLFAALLSVPLPERYAPLALTPEAQRRRTLEALARWLSALARLQPVVLVFEDLHWTDPSSLELLGRLIEQAETVPVLLLATVRSGFEPPWGPRPHLTHTTLKPLTHRETLAMVEAIAGDRALSRKVLEELVRKTDGVPLFVEELTKAVLESGRRAEANAAPRGAAPAPELEVPSTLQDSLEARLDRLGPVKDLVQLAAVLGREFSYELLASVSGQDAGTLERGLTQLATAGLVYQSGEPPKASYTFKHVLIQETAYSTLLKSKRRARHERIVRVLEERFPDYVAFEPEGVARHCEAAGLLEKAVAYYQRAGERAVERSANAEAIGHLSRGLALLRALPEASERDERELVLQVSLGALLVAAAGWGSGEAERAYDRARELCERVGEAAELFRVLRGLVTFYISRARLETASELCTRLLRLAEAQREASALLVAHQQMAILLYYQGDPSAALEHYEKALALYEPSHRLSLRYLYGEDLGVFIRIWMAWALWMLGRPDRAVDVSREAVELGRQASHPFSLAYALLWSAVVHVMRGEREAARGPAEEAMAIAQEEGFAFVAGGGRLVRAWTRLDPQRADAENDATLEEFRRALLELAATGSEISKPMILADLSAAYQALGRHRDALSTAAAALADSQQTGQAFWDADLYRIKAEALLQLDPSAEAESERLLRHGLELARRQRARSLELRVATSLSRLWKRQGKADAVRALLGGVVGSFAEGFDAPDLVEATALLQGLA